MIKHKYMFSYTANDYDGNLVDGHYILTGKELLHLHVNTFDVIVTGITELPMKVKR